MSNSQQSGFALLLTLVVVSVVLAIGLSLLDITVKQLSLSSTARDSEVAFHAANAGLECSQKTRKDIDIITAIPNTGVQFDCFQTNQVSSYSASGQTREYSIEFDWNNGQQDLCTQIDMYIMDATAGAYTYNFSNQGLVSKECTNGNICTVMFSRGYNRGCSNLAGLRTVQRELTIEF